MEYFKAYRGIKTQSTKEHEQEEQISEAAGTYC